MARSKVIILGIGNLLKGDDGVGVRVVEELHGLPFPPRVECIDGGTGGPTLLVYFENAGALVIIDAANLGAPPGTVRAFALDDIRDAAPAASLSLHEVGILPMIDLAREVGRLPPVVRIVGIQPERFDQGDELSPAVAAAVPQAVDLVIEEVGRLLEEDRA